MQWPPQPDLPPVNLHWFIPPSRIKNLDIYVFAHQHRQHSNILRGWSSHGDVMQQSSWAGVPADGRAEFVQAPRRVSGAGVVQLGQAVHPLQDHLQHVADLAQHAAGLHAPHDWVKGETRQRRRGPDERAAAVRSREQTRAIARALITTPAALHRPLDAFIDLHPVLLVPFSLPRAVSTSIVLTGMFPFHLVLILKCFLIEIKSLIYTILPLLSQTSHCRTTLTSGNSSWACLLLILLWKDPAGLLVQQHQQLDLGHVLIFCHKLVFFWDRTSRHSGDWSLDRRLTLNPFIPF